MGLFGWFGKKKKEDEIKQLLQTGDSTIMAAIARSQAELLSKFKDELNQISMDLLDTQRRIQEMNQSMKQKAIYSLTANVFVRQKHGSVKIVARYNNHEAMRKFIEMLKGGKDIGESGNQDIRGSGDQGNRISGNQGIESRALGSDWDGPVNINSKAGSIHNTKEYGRKG